MGKTNGTKKALVEDSDDPYKAGTVLFSSGDTKHADVWDDSELIDHWDRTVEVYRAQYLKQTQAEEAEPPIQKGKRKVREGYIQKKRSVQQKKQTNVNQNYSASQLPHAAPNLPQTHNEEEQVPKNSQQMYPGIPSQYMNGQPPMPSMPFVSPMSSASSSNRQEDLSNLMMAWYYCGYYTGLYQGKR